MYYLCVLDAGWYLELLNPSLRSLSLSLSSEVITMPIVQIELWEGRTDAQKAKLIEAVSEVFQDLDVKKDHEIVAIHETPRSNWGLGGLHRSQRTYYARVSAGIR